MTLYSPEECPGMWTRQVLHIFFGAFQIFHQLQVKSVRGVFSNLIPSVISTVGIFPSIFFIRRFYYTFINRSEIPIFPKMLTAFLNKIYPQWEPCTYACLEQLLGTLFIKFSFNSVTSIYQKKYPQGRKPNTHSSQSSATHSVLLLDRAFFIPRCIALFFEIKLQGEITLIIP